MSWTITNHPLKVDAEDTATDRIVDRLRNDSDGLYTNCLRYREQLYQIREKMLDEIKYAFQNVLRSIAKKVELKYPIEKHGEVYILRIQKNYAIKWLEELFFIYESEAYRHSIRRKQEELINRSSIHFGDSGKF